MKLKLLFLAALLAVSFSKLFAVPEIIWQMAGTCDAHSIALSPNGAYLAVGGFPNSNYGAFIVNTSDGSYYRTYEIEAIDDIKFSPTGKYLAYCGSSQVTIRDFVEDTIVFCLPTTGASDIDFSPDEQTLIIGRGGWLDFWDLDTKTKIDSLHYTVWEKYIGYRDASIFDACYSPDGKYIAFTSESRGGFIVLDATTRQEVFSYGTTTWYSRLRFSPNSKMLAFVSNKTNTALEILDLDSMKISYSAPQYNSCKAFDLWFSKDCKNLYFTGAGTGEYLNRLNLINNKAENIFNIGTWENICFSNDEQTLYAVVANLYAINFSPYLSVEEPINNRNLIVSPNISQTSLNVSFNSLSGEYIRLQIFNVQGQILKEFTAYTVEELFEKECDISDLSSGSYILNVKSPSYKISSKFLIAR